jgi:transmembrane sensor
MKMNKKKLEELYLRYLNGEQPGEEELAEAREWLAKDETNKAYLERLNKAIKAETLTRQLESVDVKENWERFRERISGKTIERSQNAYLPGNRIPFLRIAAVVAILLAGTAIFFAVRSRSVHSFNPVSAVDRIRKIELPDGSRVLLNQGSVFSCPKKFPHKRREVELTGEAYFEIKRNENAPFFVHLERLTVEVLGTSFTIKEAEAGNTTVNVHTGKVAFYEQENADNRVELAAGRKGTYDVATHEFRQDSLDAASTFFWNKEKLNFKDQPLEEVFSILGEVFTKEFRVRNPEILDDRITSKCAGLGLEEILDEFSIMFNIQYEIRSDTVVIQRKH